MLDGTTREITYFLFRGNMPEQQNQNIKGTGQHQQSKLGKNVQTNKADFENDDYSVTDADREDGRTQVKQEPIKVGPKVGRNDPCPCGSGKKFKQCHGQE